MKQLKHHFHLGTVLERAPEFMKGTAECECPKRQIKWDTHVVMNASQIMMGCQRVKIGDGKDKEETTQLTFHADSGPVVEDGESKTLLAARSMDNFMHGLSCMIPIQKEWSMMTKTPDGHPIKNT